MKSKLIAGIISICVIGGAGVAIVMNSQENSSNNLSNNNVVQERSINNTKVKSDENKGQEKVQSKDGEYIKESNDQIAVVENNESIEENTNQKSEKVNEIINNSSQNDEVKVQGNNDTTTNTSNNTNNVNTDINMSNQSNEEISKPNTGVQNQIYDSNFMAEVESMIFNKVNEERAKNGLPPLSYNSTMEHYARVKSQDMGDRGYFDHNNPEGELMTAQMLRDGVTYNAWGENIAYIGGISDANALANQFMTNWMNSSGHRANILSSNFTSIGVGVYKIGNTVYATQEFYR